MMGIEQKKPSLQEIAEMPYSQSLDALRKHYDPKWGVPQAEGINLWRVKFEWTISGTFDREIEAETAEEALEIAEDWARNDADSGDFDVMFSKVTPV